MSLPGHGPRITDIDGISYVQAYYKDLTQEIRRLKDLGYSAEEAATRADLRQHAQTLGVRQLGANFEAVKRMYDIWDGLIQ